MSIIRHHQKALQIAATFVGTIVGAGFATGKEIVQFFTRYGAWGTLGIIASGLLFIWVGTKIMILAADIRAKSYKDLNLYLFGNTIGGFINLIILFALFGVTAVMLSGAGAVFQEQIGLPFQFGLLVTIGLCYISLTKGLKGVMAVNTFVVPIMILFTLGVAVSRLPFIHLNHLIPDISLSVVPYHWLISAFTYVSFNLITAQAVLVPLGGDIRNHAVIKRGGLYGGIILTLLLLASHIALTASSTAIAFQIPMAELIKALGPVIHLLYVSVIFGEIFTTFIGNIFGLKRHLAQLVRVKERMLMGLLLGAIYLISQIGYGPLLSHLYPFFGYLGMVFMIYIMLKGTSRL